jgi:hypothetical protein
VTLPPDMRDGAVARNSMSTRTEPVNQAAGPLAEGCAPAREILNSPSPYAAAAEGGLAAWE